ncbi:hypothetical protein HY485_01675 [Candidatus Woesearchaeota archaeon]|nr:hypothetical protein [Candidatus Woesearchaeota archaeon]
MHPDEAKTLITKILASDVSFEGHFNKCFENLKDTQQQELIDWIKDCKERKINPIQSKTNKDIIGFIKRIGSNIRTILTKQKEGYFLVLFLDKHKYYETQMIELGF